MDLVALYLFLPFAVLLVIGVPIAVTLGLASAFFILFSGWGRPPIVLVTEMYVGVALFALLAVPMFVLTGELMNRCELTEKLIKLAQHLVGWMRGGLAHVNIVASMLFAGISGSAVADAASLGPILIPAMIREKFPADFSVAVTAASAIIGPIIPPSTVAIIIGSQLEISIGGLFAGGIVPGILIGISLMSVSWYYSRKYGYGEVRKFEGLCAIAHTSRSALPALIIPVFILGGILGGVFTPTEAGAAAAVYMMVIGRFYYRTLDWRRFVQSLIATSKVTASALFIVATALVFSRILTFYRIPEEILQLILSISGNRIVIALIVIAFFLVMGMFNDAVANMIILGPLLMPIAVSPLGLGMEPVQYGLFLAVGLLLGLITPPVGLLLFICCPIAKVSLERASLATLPFLLAELVVLLLIAFVQPVTMAIPRALGLG
jgi:tripartite ATP-independent transporter DctM subunit